MLKKHLAFLSIFHHENNHKLYRNRITMLKSSEIGQAIGVGYESRFALIEDAVKPKHDAKTTATQTSLYRETKTKIVAMYKKFSSDFLVTKSTRKSPVDGGPAEDMSISGIADGELLNTETKVLLGYVECKPVVSSPCMYETIPRMDLAQIMTTMAISNVGWCDFVAVHPLQKKIFYQRVQFNSRYWAAIKPVILDTIAMKTKALGLQEQNRDPLVIAGIDELRRAPGDGHPFERTALFDGEAGVVKENMITLIPSSRKRQPDRYQFVGSSKPPKSFDQLFELK